MGNKSSTRITLDEAKIEYGRVNTHSPHKMLCHIAEKYNKYPHEIRYYVYRSDLNKLLISNMNKRILIINNVEFKKCNIKDVINMDCRKTTIGYQKKCIGEYFFVIIEDKINYSPQTKINTKEQKYDKEQIVSWWIQRNKIYPPSSNPVYHQNYIPNTYTYYSHGHTYTQSGFMLR